MREMVDKRAGTNSMVDNYAPGEVVREFLRGRTCRIVYRHRKRQEHEVQQYSQLAEDRTARLVEYRDGQTKGGALKGIRPMEPMISPDGTRIAYNTSFMPTDMFVCYLDRDVPPVNIGFGANPRWWVDTDTGEEYIVYRTECAKTTWPDLPGVTLKQKIRKGGCVPVDEPVQVYPKGFGAGLTPDGRYLVTGYASLDIVDLVTSQHRQLFGGRQVCSVTIAPDDTNRLMELRLPHDRFGYHNLDGTDDVEIFKPQGSTEWLTPSWSNDPDFAVAAAGNYGGTYDIYLIRLSDQAMMKVIWGGDCIHPHLWVR
ncbi:MAG: hypothetical protein GF344_16275 [Chitinivibrionales bacterium]|nr:hypothetical protein [Chitinivibrionales bacterium]MBD3358254.1 hypothetical protein [Chitinivibrionales bacterium]